MHLPFLCSTDAARFSNPEAGGQAATNSQREALFRLEGGVSICPCPGPLEGGFSLFPRAPSELLLLAESEERIRLNVNT